MILSETKRPVSVSGKFESTGFSVETSAKAFKVLSDNIYVNKTKAVIRELSTNAQDIHIQMGKKDVPFDVHLPVTLEPWFSVRDYGTGLSVEEAMNTYTRYFHSTRTDSNDYTGALGLGSKSPFAIADSFTVTSIIDGVKYVYTAYKDEDDCPQFSLITQEESDEPSGLEVTVHVDRHLIERFQKEAVQVYKYFDNVPNINVPTVANQIKEPLRGVTLEGEDFLLSNRYGRMVAVMGNVAYEIPNILTDFSCEGILYFNVGELNFNPGREHLTLDDKTKEAIKNRFQTIQSQAVDMIIDIIKTADTSWKKRKAYHEYYMGVFGAWLKKSNKMNAYEPPVHDDTFKCMIKNGRRQNSRVVIQKEYNMPMGKEVHYFLDVPGNTHRLRHFVRHNEVTAVLLKQEQIDAWEIDSKDIEDASELPKPPRSPRGQSTHQVKTYTWDGYVRYGKDIKRCWNEAVLTVDTETERVYVAINRFSPSAGQGFYSLSEMSRKVKACRQAGVQIHDSDIYGLKNSYVDSKDFKKAKWISLNDFLQREIEKCIKERAFVSYNGDFKDLFTAIADASGPDEFKEFKDLMEKVDTTKPAVLKSLGIEVAYDNSPDTMEELLLEAYPMLRFVKDFQQTDLANILTYVKGDS